MYISEIPIVLYHKTRIYLKRVIDCILWTSTLTIKRTPFDPFSIKKILLINLQGIGDLVMTTPFLDALRKKFPDAHIDYLTAGKNGEVFSADKRVDHVLSYLGGMLNTSLTQILKTIRSEKYDLCINLFYAQHSAILCRCSGAKYTIGCMSSLRVYRNFTLKDKTREEKAKKATHETTRDLRKQCKAIAEGLGINIQDFDDLSVQYNEQPQQSLEKQGIGKTKKTAEKKELIVCIHPGATWETKQWQEEKWVQLCIALQQKYALQNPTFFFIGGVESVSLVEKITSKLPEDITIVQLAGNLSIQELIPVLAKVDLFITTDSGPMHIAYALKKKTVALFGVTKPELLISEKPFFKVIHKPENHRHLFGKCFDFNNQPLQSCHVTMENITVDDVMNAAEALRMGRKQ